jgi:hypothetical protein
VRRRDSSAIPFNLSHNNPTSKKEYEEEEEEEEDDEVYKTTCQNLQNFNQKLS